MYGSGRLLLSIKKEVSGTFSFTCPVTALPVSYCRCLTLCTALFTSPPGHPGLPATTCIYVVGLLPVELNFILVLQREIVVTPNYLCFDCIILKKWKRTMKIKTTVSFSVLHCFHSTGYLLMKECIYYLLTEKKAAHKMKHMSRPVFSCCVHIPSHSFQFCHSCHQ